MPYNSSSFEKQLARYKAAQAGKAIENVPSIDPHRARARVAAAQGRIQPNVVVTSQVVGDGPQSTPVLRPEQLADAELAGQTVIIVKGKKKPLWARGWFVFLLTTVLSTAAMPIFFKEEMAEMKGLLQTVKTTTGVDPLSMKTYTNMVKGAPVETAPVPEAAADVPAPTTDIHAVVDKAQQKAEDVTSRGAGHSMKYIEDETKRLNDMAKQLDQQYNGTK